MPQTYTCLHYHLVFSTKHRLPVISTDLQPRLWEYLGGVIRGLGGKPIQVGGVADHVHLLVTLRQEPALRSSGVMNEIVAGSGEGNSPLTRRSKTRSDLSPRNRGRGGAQRLLCSIPNPIAFRANQAHPPRPRFRGERSLRVFEERVRGKHLLSSPMHGWSFRHRFLRTCCVISKLVHPVGFTTHSRTSAISGGKRVTVRSR